MRQRIPTDRPTRVFRNRFTVRLEHNANLIVPNQPVYRSPVLDLRGTTLVNAYVHVIVRSDTSPTEDIEIIARITDDTAGVVSRQGTLVASSLGGQQGVQYKGRGDYDGGLIGPFDVLFTGARWALFVAAKAQDGTRDIEFDVDGVLVAGGGTER